MATLSHFLPHFPSLSSHNSQTTTASFSFFNHHSVFHSNRGFSNGQFSVVCLASTKKSRPSRKLMGDAELCNALREFMISVGLPEGHVPSTKELSQHGRKDLANIVRRRGHKLIQELLSNSVEVATDGSNSLRSLNGDSNENSNHGETGRELADIPSVNNDPATGSSLVAKHESTLVSKDEIPVSNDPPISLQEKVENFMKYGQLDAVEDDLWGDFKLNDGKVRLNHEQNPVEGETVNSEEHIRKLAHGSDNKFGQNGTIQSIAPTMEDKYKRNMNSSTQGPENTDFDNNMHIEADNMVNKVEINHLKHLLHLKELELSRLKEDIEKEKAYQGAKLLTAKGSLVGVLFHTLHHCYKERGTYARTAIWIVRTESRNEHDPERCRRRPGSFSHTDYKILLYNYYFTNQNTKSFINIKVILKFCWVHLIIYFYFHILKKGSSFLIYLRVVYRVSVFVPRFESILVPCNIGLAYSDAYYDLPYAAILMPLVSQMSRNECKTEIYRAIRPAETMNLLAKMIPRIPSNPWYCK